MLQLNSTAWEEISKRCSCCIEGSGDLPMPTHTMPDNREKQQQQIHKDTAESNILGLRFSVPDLTEIHPSGFGFLVNCSPESVAICCSSDRATGSGQLFLPCLGGMEMRIASQKETFQGIQYPPWTLSWTSVFHCCSSLLPQTLWFMREVYDTLLLLLAIQNHGVGRGFLSLKDQGASFLSLVSGGCYQFLACQCIAPVPATVVMGKPIPILLD